MSNGSNAFSQNSLLTRIIVGCLLSFFVIQTAVKKTVSFLWVGIPPPLLASGWGWREANQWGESISPNAATACAESTLIYNFL